MASIKGQLKQIAPVPTADDFLDIVLSGVQRKTPTVIHKNFKISRIRSFYMRKAKFAADLFEEKLDAILTDFPILDNLHPFLASLLNVLYDKNHYKLALGQLNTCRHLISQVSKDYLRLLKFGDSLYRCKQLKRAALGRMATIIKRQSDPLAYLEQVRQHLSRLPNIDPSTRTLLICGYPNVGKSSFINKVTRADVDVQPYAFTTKSLFVGHCDYKYLRWQVIDTPGILDHPLEEMNTIEMQSITAMAHLRCAILYFMDLSEQCGYTIEAQCKLFQSIKPLFANKPVLLVINKIDVCRLEDLSPENAALVNAIVTQEDVTMLQLSCLSEEGVMDVRNTACDTLLAHRVEQKMRGGKINSVLNKIHVSVPKPRDDLKREAFIPEAVATKQKYDKNDPNRILLERDLEVANGGCGVYNFDMKKNYILDNPEWKYDVIPEVYMGKNIADFIDPDIMAKLEALEREEEKLEADGFYNEDEELLDSEDEQLAQDAKAIRREQEFAKMASLEKKQFKNRAIMPRTVKKRTLNEFSEHLSAVGLDPSKIEERAQAAIKARNLIIKRKREEEAADAEMEDAGDADGMDIDEPTSKRSKKHEVKARAIADKPVHPRAPTKNRQTGGISTKFQEEKALKIRNYGQRERNQQAKAGEADHHVPITMPKWLLAGKRKGGKTDRR